MKKYDFSFLKGNIPSKIVNLTSIIYDLRSKEEIRINENEKLFNKLKEIAIIESIKGSNAIEGIVTTDKRIKEIVNGDNNPLTHDEKEITGYRNVINEIHLYHSSISVNLQYILSLHEKLFEFTGSMNKGQFKKYDNFIMEINNDGKRKIRFVPVKAKDVDDAMEQLMLAYYEARQDSEINPLLLIPCVILDFLCIHPFDDGNGRISRLLTVLLLYQNGFNICKYVSFESKINKYKDSYYIALQNSSEGWMENQNDYVPFIINFIQTLYQCYKELDEKFINNKIMKKNKSKRVEEIIFNSYIPISKSKIVELAPDISIQTIENTLNKLIKEEKIVKIGSFKDAKYIKK